jgi:hypothetical protein
MFDLSTKNRGVKNKLNLLQIEIENVKRNIRSAQNKLSILHRKCDIKFSWYKGPIKFKIQYSNIARKDYDAKFNFTKIV